MRLGRRSELAVAAVITGAAITALCIDPRFYSAEFNEQNLSAQPASAPLAGSIAAASVESPDQSGSSESLHSAPVLAAAAGGRSQAGADIDTIIQSPLLQAEAPRALPPATAQVTQTTLAFSQTRRSGAYPPEQDPYRRSMDVGRGELSLALRDLRDPAYADLVEDARTGRAALVLEPSRPDPAVAFDYAVNFQSAGAPGEFDLALRPHAEFAIGPHGSAAGGGAELRLGRYLDAPDDAPRWYVFAAADRRALTYDPSRGTDYDSVALTDREIVGDAQAGVAMRVGEVDLSLAYVQRDYRHIAGVEKFDEQEEYGAVSLNYRW